jgi:hypothetical protein
MVSPDGEPPLSVPLSMTAMRGEVAVTKSGAVALQPAVMRENDNIDGPQLVNGADEFYFLIPRKIAQMENPKLAECDRAE